MIRSVGLSRRTDNSIRSNPGFSRLPGAVDGRFTPKSVTCWPLRVSVFGAVIVGAGVGTVTVGVGVGGAGNNNVPSAGPGDPSVQAANSSSEIGAGKMALLTPSWSR